MKKFQKKKYIFIAQDEIGELCFILQSREWVACKLFLKRKRQQKMKLNDIKKPSRS